MTWRNVAFGGRHFAYLEGPGSVDVVDIGNGASAPTSGTVESLRDDRAGGVVTWAAADLVRFTRASGSPAIDALFLPPGHNLTSVRVLNASTTELLPATAVTEGEPALLEFAAGTAELVLRLEGTPSSGDCRLGELLYTALAVPNGGPEPGFDAETEPVLRTRELENGGEVQLARGRAQRVFDFTFTQAGLPAADALADTALFDELVALQAAGRPFVFRPPWDTAIGVWVRLARLRRRAENPRRGYAAEELYTHRLELREHTA